MANKLAGEVAFSAGGRSYTLRLGVNELLSLQGELGVEDDQHFLQTLGSRVKSLRDLRALFRFALSKQHPEVTEDQAGDLMTEVGMDRATALMLEAIRWALPAAPAKAAAGEGKATARSAGKPS